MANFFSAPQTLLLVPAMAWFLAGAANPTMRAPTPMTRMSSASTKEKPVARILTGATTFSVQGNALYAPTEKSLLRYAPAKSRTEVIAKVAGPLRHYAVSPDGNGLLLHFDQKAAHPAVHYNILKPASTKAIPLDGLKPSEMMFAQDGARAVLISPKSKDPWRFRVLEADLNELKLAWRPMFEGYGVLFASRGDGLVFGEPTQSAQTAAPEAEPVLEKLLHVDFRSGKTQVLYQFKAPAAGRHVMVLADEGHVTWLQITDGAENASIGMVDWAKGDVTMKSLPRDYVPFGPGYILNTFWFVVEAPATSRLILLETEGTGRFVPDGTLPTSWLRRLKTAHGAKRHGLFWKRLDGQLYLFDNAGTVKEIPLSKQSAKDGKWSWTGTDVFMPDADSFYFGVEQGKKSFVMRFPTQSSLWP